jgi:D-alanyl-D-alanine carboxypeptidase (penicillin-binding protein 5/6)
LNNLKKVWFISVLLTLICSAINYSSGYAVEKVSPIPTLQLPCQAALLIEAESGKIIFAKEPHKRWPPASMTKMMLMLIVMEKIEEGSIKLEEEIIVSAFASKIGGSQVYLKEGEVFTLEELMKAIVIHSANDACVAIAEYTAGSSEAFVDMMNQRAQELGLKETEYHSVHGLPPGRGQKEDLTSAYDLATLGKEIVKYPLILKWGSTRQDSFRSGQFILYNTNKLVGRLRGIDGIKTGFYSKAKFNVTATGQRDGLRFIAVILGADTNKSRFKQASRLLNMAFNNYEKVKILKAGDPVGDPVKISGGKKNITQPLAGKDAIALVRKTKEKQIEIKTVVTEPIAAPLKQGEEIGIVIITLNGEVLTKVPAVMGEEIPQAHLFWRIFPFFD